MILADENVHSFIVKVLREAGNEAVSINETSKGIKDQQIIQWALQNNYIILTEDKDFGEWVFAPHIQNLSIIFLRYSFEDYKAIAFLLGDFLNKTKLQHSVFVTLTTKKIRIRQL